MQGSEKNKANKIAKSSDNESEPEVSPPNKRKRPLRKRHAKTTTTKKRKNSGSGSDFQPTESEDEDEEDEDESSGEKSENLSEDNISDSDFIPDSDEDRDQNQTIDLSSDNDSPKNERTQTFDPNSKEFWSKVEELKAKGFSIQQTSNLPAKTVNGGAAARGRNIPPQGGPANNKLSAFTQLYINFEHEKRCRKKCFMMEGRQKQTLKEVRSPNWLSPEFMKACIRVVQCCIRIGDLPTAREGIDIINNLGEVQGISALSQAMISGCKVHQETLETLERTEREAMEAMKNKDFNQALELLDKAIEQSTGCIRVKMTRGDCLAHLGRYVDGAKAASSILVHDQKNVGALFLRGFCLYHKDNIDRAMTHFQQVLQINKDHTRAKALLQKSRQYREKKEQGAKAASSNNVKAGISIYNDALGIDPRNKGTNAKLLASRAELYAKKEDYDRSIEDCVRALELDTTCLVAMVQRGKCYMAKKNWEQAVRDLERVNNRDRHNQQNKKKAGDAALRANNHDEAFRMYQEALAVDKHNQTYRALLRQAKKELAKQSRKDFYGVLGLEATCGESEVRKAYFKKSKEYHPDRHAGKTEDEKEELSNKFKLVKEAYETLSDNSRRQIFDGGEVKPPPGGWYQDLDSKVLEGVRPPGALRGMIRGGARGFQRGGGIVVRGNMRGGRLITRVQGGGVRGVPVQNVQFRGNRGNVPMRGNVAMRTPLRGGTYRGMPVRGIVRGGLRPGVRPMVNMVNRRPMARPGMAPRGVRMNGFARGAAGGVVGSVRAGLPSSVTITPMSEVTIDD